MRRSGESLLYILVMAAVVVHFARTPQEDAPSRRRPPIIVEEAPLPSDPPSQNAGTSPAKPRAGLPEFRINESDKAHNASGSAVAVDGYGLFMSARHVTHGCDNVYIEADPARNGERRWMRAERVVEHPFADLVLIDTGDRSGVSLGTPAVMGSAPRSGAEGVMVGYPQGNPGWVSAEALGEVNVRFDRRGGRAFARKGRRGTRAERGTAWVETGRSEGLEGSLGGLSGGPAYLADGTLVGIVVAESRRRGRVVTSQPGNMATLASFARSGRRPSFRNGLDNESARLRQERSVAFVYCEVSS